YFDELYLESSVERPRYIPFTMHPYIIGRPGRTLALRGIIHHMKKAGNLWFPTGIELAEWCLNNVFQAECQKLRASAGYRACRRAIAPASDDCGSDRRANAPVHPVPRHKAAIDQARDTTPLSWPQHLDRIAVVPSRGRRELAMGGAMMIGVAVGLAVAMASAVPTQAQPVADFYRGKTLRMLIGYGPGGGYDIYGRLVAEFLPRHLPGNPTIVTQNMPGAGSFVAAKYMYDVAPKDGTVFGSLAQTLALDSMTNTSAKLDVTKMPYMGRVVTNI